MLVLNTVEPGQYVGNGQGKDIGDHETGENVAPSYRILIDGLFHSLITHVHASMLART